jgi:phage gp36-like protein
MYANLVDLYARYGEEEINQIADTDETGTPDPILIKRTSADIDAEIDAALMGRFKVPLSPVPQLIRRIACELTLESIWLHAGSCPKAVREAAALARELLKNLALGILRLDAEPVESGPLTSDARLTTQKERMQW